MYHTYFNLFYLYLKVFHLRTHNQGIHTKVHHYSPYIVDSRSDLISLYQFNVLFIIWCYKIISVTFLLVCSHVICPYVLLRCFACCTPLPLCLEYQVRESVYFLSHCICLSFVHHRRDDAVEQRCKASCYQPV